MGSGTVVVAIIVVIVFVASLVGILLVMSWSKSDDFFFEPYDSKKIVDKRPPIERTIDNENRKRGGNTDLALAVVHAKSRKVIPHAQRVSTVKGAATPQNIYGKSNLFFQVVGPSTLPADTSYVTSLTANLVKGQTTAKNGSGSGADYFCGSSSVDSDTGLFFIDNIRNSIVPVVKSLAGSSTSGTNDSQTPIYAMFVSSSETGLSTQVFTAGDTVTFAFLIHTQEQTYGNYAAQISIVDVQGNNVVLKTPSILAPSPYYTVDTNTGSIWYLCFSSNGQDATGFYELAPNTNPNGSGSGPTNVTLNVGSNVNQMPLTPWTLELTVYNSSSYLQSSYSVTSNYPGLSISSFQGQDAGNAGFVQGFTFDNSIISVDFQPGESFSTSEWRLLVESIAQSASSLFNTPVGILIQSANQPSAGTMVIPIPSNQYASIFSSAANNVSFDFSSSSFSYVAGETEFQISIVLAVTNVINPTAAQAAFVTSQWVKFTVYDVNSEITGVSSNYDSSLPACGTFWSAAVAKGGTNYQGTMTTITTSLAQPTNQSEDIVYDPVGVTATNTMWIFAQVPNPTVTLPLSDLIPKFPDLSTGFNPDIASATFSIAGYYVYVIDDSGTASAQPNAVFTVGDSTQNGIVLPTSVTNFALCSIMVLPPFLSSYKSPTPWSYAIASTLSCTLASGSTPFSTAINWSSPGNAFSWSNMFSISWSQYANSYAFPYVFYSDPPELQNAPVCAVSTCTAAPLTNAVLSQQNSSAAVGFTVAPSTTIADPGHLTVSFTSANLMSLELSLDCLQNNSMITTYAITYNLSRELLFPTYTTNTSTNNGNVSTGLFPTFSVEYVIDLYAYVEDYLKTFELEIGDVINFIIQLTTTVTSKTGIVSIPLSASAWTGQNPWP